MIAAAAPLRHARVVPAVAMLLVWRVMIAVERVLDMLGRGPARRAEEGEEDQPPRIEARQKRRERADEEGDVPGHRAARPAVLEDRVLRPESGKADPADAHAGDRQRADDHHPEGD